MSRRFVSVCILALAGIISFSAGWTGRSTSRRFLISSRANKYELNQASRIRNAYRRPQTGAEVISAPAQLQCAQFHQCSTPLAIPMTFEPNVGQFAGRIQYAGRGTGMTVLLTESGMAVRVTDSSRAPVGPAAVVGVSVHWADVDGRRGRDSRFTWRGEQRVKTVSNYFIGRNPRYWRTDVPHFARAVGNSRSSDRAALIVHGTDGGIEYDLRLKPGADTSKVRLRFSGASRVAISDGDIILGFGETRLRMAKPKIYEELPDGLKRTVRGEYLMEADGSVGFRLGPHDPHATLVVDPTLTVVYATFLGGAGNETAGNVAIDASGKVYVSGVTTSSTSFPETSGAAIGTAVGPSVFYVAKFDPTVTGTNSLLYLTFLGGSGTQAGGLIALDRAGDVALTGTTTSTDYPVTSSSQPTKGLTSGDGNDAVVSEINARGNQLNFSAYFGGSGEISVNGPGGIAVDGLGNVYIASDVQPSAANPASPDLPVTSGALQPAWGGEGSDGFLALLTPPTQTGGAPSVTYCTYLGTNSAGQVGLGGVAVDSNGNAYIAGSTSNASSGFPVLNAFQSAYGGGTSDGFVMKIAPRGQGSADLVYSTMLGGSGTDEILAIALDSSLSPKAYVTGETQSSDFPLTAATAYQSKLNANPVVKNSANAFLAVIAQDPISGHTSLAYSSYLGGSGTDSGDAIAVVAPQGVYIAGQTNSPDFPWHDNLQPFNGGVDAFLVKLDPTSAGAASLIYSTPLGGTSPPGGAVSAGATGVVAGGANQVYVTGETSAADFPTAVTTSGAANGFQQNCASCQEATPSADAFAVAISESATSGPSVYFNMGSESFGSSNLGSQLSGQPVAVLNGGEQNLVISDIEVIGPNSGDFSTVGQAGCIGTQIPPGPAAHCSMDVSFTPSSGGPEEAFLAIKDNAPGSPQLLEMRGTGDAPHAQVLPPNLTFGNQPINTVSSGQTITVTNTGNENLTLSGDVSSPVGTPFQSQGGSCRFPQTGWSLAPGASCTVLIAFAPTGTGADQGQLQVLDNSDFNSNAQQVVTLSGAGVPAVPLAQLSPSGLTFGNTVVGSASASQSVTLQNQGSAALDVTAISIGGTNATDFEVSSAGTTCPTAGGTVAPGSKCTVAVQFAPQSASGSKSAVLSVVDNSAPSPQSVTLSGLATAQASLTVSPGSLSFGSVSEGASGAAQVVTITNSGTGDAGLSGIIIVGSADFAQQNACPPVLTSGAHCQVSVTFSPAETTAPGTRTGTLTIPGGTPASVALSGTATQAGISFTKSLSFASQLVSTAGPPQPVTITNSSSGSLAGALQFTGISIGGANKSDFSITANQCSSSGSAGVAPGNSCTVQLTFDPQPGATCGDDPNRSASLQLQDNAPGSPQTVPLSGAAADFCLATANGQPATTPIQPGQTASYSLEVASAGGFTGTVNLSCSVPSAGADIGPCAIATTPTSNPPSVQVTPTAAPQFTLTVPTVAPSELIPLGVRPMGGPRAEYSVLACVWLACVLLLAAAPPKSFSDGLGRRGLRAIRFIQMAVLGAGLAVGIAACGSGSGGSGPPSSPGTAPGTYTITVTASATNGGNSTTRTASLALTVAPSSN